MSATIYHVRTLLAWFAMPTAFAYFLLANALSGQAQTQNWYYDTSSAPGLGGSPRYWGNGSGDSVWTQDSTGASSPVVTTWGASDDKIAVFDGTPTSVLVSGTVYVSGLQFNTSGYELWNDTINLRPANSGINVVNAADTAHIVGTLAGSGFQKRGGGTLVLSSPSGPITGTISIQGGTLEFVQQASMPTSSPIVVQNSGSTLAVAVTGAANHWGTGTSGVGTMGGLIAGTGRSSDQITWNAGTNLGIATYDSSVTYSGVIGNFRSGSGTTRNDVGLTKTGGGTLTLSGTNTYTGTTTISGGTLSGNSIANGNSPSAFGAGSSFTLQNGGTLEYTGPTNSTNRVVTLGTNGGTISVTSSLTLLTLSGAISGNGTLTKTGAGEIRLDATTNSYLGATNISAGTLRLGGSGVIPDSSAVSVNNASLNMNGFDETIGSLAGNSNSQVSLKGGMLTVGTNNTSTTYNGFINDDFGNRGITKVGSGTLTLTGSNSYTGPTRINGGTLSGNTITNVDSNSAFGNKNFEFSNGATLQYTGGTSTNNRSYKMNAGGGAIDVASAATTLTLTGLIDGAGSFTKLGAGTLTLASANTYTGGTTSLKGGTLKLGAHQGVRLGSALTIESGATFNLNNFSQTIGSLAGAGNVTLGTSTLNTGGDNSSTTFAGSISGTGAVNKNGTGTMTLTGASSYGGNTSVNAGNLTITGGGGLSDGMGLIGSVFGTIGHATVGGGTGNSTWTNSLQMIVGENGTGTLNITGGGSVSSPQGFVGGSSGTGNVAVGGGTGNSTWTNSGNLSIGYSGTGTLSVTGGGSVSSKVGVLAESPGSTGNVTVGGGTGNSSWTNTNGLTVGAYGAGTLNVTGGGSVSSVTGFLGFLSAASGNVTVGGGTGNSTWTNTSSLTVGLNGTGTLNINTGGLVSALALDGGNATSSVKINGGTLRITGTDTASDTINLLSAGGTIEISSNATNFTVTSSISGVGGLTKTGIGTLTLSGNNSYAGPTIINVGTIKLGTLNAIPDGSAVILANAVNDPDGAGPIAPAGANLDLNNQSETIASLAGGGAAGGNVQLGSGTLTVGDTTSTIYGGRLSGTGRVIKNGFGVLTLTGTNNYSGSTTVSAGTLKITDGGTVSNSIGYIGFDSGNNGTVTVGGGSGNSTWTNSGILIVGNSGTGILSVTGGGSVSNTGVAYIGGNSGSNGTVTVGGGTGSSAWTNSSEVMVGYFGTGTLNITGGGTVSNTFSTIGRTPGSTGLVNVGGGTGPSTWTNSSTLAVGTLGTGTLNISTGGLVSAPALDGGNATSGISFNGGALRITGTDMASNTISLLSSGGTIDVPTAGTTFTVTSAISGAGGLTKTGSGTMTLTSPNTYGGSTAIENGTVAVSAGNNRLPTGTVVILGSGANSGVLKIGDSTAAQSQSVAALTTSGSGTANAVVGGHTTNNSTLTVNNASDFTYSGRLGGAGSGENNLAITKAGGGILTLTGANTYTGVTTVNSGTLLANNSASGPGSATGTGTVTVNAGGTLGGTGKITGSVHLMGGTLAPGASIESLGSGTLDLDAGTFAYELNSSALTADLQNVTGDLNIDLAGAVTLALLDEAMTPLPLPAGTIFTLISYSGAWNGGLFTYEGNSLANGVPFLFNGGLVSIRYDNTERGTNFGGGPNSAHYVTLAAVPEASSIIAVGLSVLTALGAAKFGRRRGWKLGL